MSLLVNWSAFLLVSAANAPLKPAPIVPLTLIHPTSYDVRLHVDPDGTATVEHALGVRVSGGPLRAVELKGIDPAAIPASEVQFKSEDGHVFPGSIVVKEDGGVRVESLEEKGLKRGAYTLRFALKSDLVKSDALKRDGAFYRLAWKSPTLGDGVDGMRVVFDLPAAPTEPRSGTAMDEAAGGAAGTVIATLRRGPSRDELEIVRPHVGRGEAALWEARIDPRALPAVHSPGIAPRPLPVAAAVSTPAETPWAPAAIAGLVMAVLAWWKLRSPRALLGGIGVGLAAHAVMLEAPIWGAVATIAACLALVHPLALWRARRLESSASLRARGPGEWLALRPADAFATAETPWLSLTTRRGLAVWIVALALVSLAGWLASDLDERAPLAAIVAALALTTLFSQSRPSARHARARAPLAVAYGKLMADESLRVVPWARIPRGRELPEEVRVRVVPRLPMPGLLSLELGTGGEDLEVLVRVRDDSPAARRIAARAASASMFPAPRTVPGRTSAERVLSLEAPSPSVTAACALARDLGALFVDRRAGEADLSFSGLERRAGL